MITYINNYFQLDTENTSYIMRVLSNGILQHVYYGQKLPQEDLSYYHLLRDCGFSPLVRVDGYETSLDTIPQEYPTFGRGDYRHPALVVEGEEGRIINELFFDRYEVVQGKPDIEGMPHLDVHTEQVETLVIAMKDKITGVEVMLHYSVFFDSDIISRYVVVKNSTQVSVQIQNIASLSIDFETAEYDFISLQGAWLRERHLNRLPVRQGTTSIESRRGSSSHQLNPFVALAAKNTDEFHGEVYGFSLIYSADFRILAEVNQYDNTRLQAGINPETFSWKLLPGEIFATPEAIMTYTDKGFNRMSQNFHNVCRRHLGKCADKTIKHPIIINSWEAMYFDITAEKIKKFILDCRGLGIDTFVLDDGWFGSRDNDTTSLGDWTVDENKFERGLREIVDFCHGNDMKFGIWFEPEMISRNSALFNEHPDWCIHYKGMQPIESRNQLVLDMSRKEVVDNIYEQMANIIQDYDISYIKWDCNRYLTDIGSATLSKECQKEHTHRHIMGVYSLMKRLTDNFPTVFFEGCSGGGGRYDFGILYYMPQIWTSDNSDAVERLKIQYGTSYLYPPLTMVGHVSACPNHQTGRITPFETRGEVAQMCNYGYELNIGMLTEEEKAMVRNQVARHKQIEPLIKNGDFYRLKNPFETNQCAWEFVSDDKEKAYVSVTFQAASPNPKQEYIKLQGLNSEYRYFVKQLGVTVCGEVLMKAGLPIRTPLNEYTVFVFDLERVFSK